ncbi:MAG: hypothetical protein HYT72_01510 [Candidatus Aenigmarchaeota archaeon]|nr:hypothetical protein [Candidatus Aenigmarchaeota archaeon]
MNEFDKQYWEYALALARHDPHQREMQTTVESCFYPGMLKPGQELQDGIDERKMSLLEIVNGTKQLMRHTPQDKYAAFRDAAVKGLNLRARHFMGESVDVVTEAREVFGLPYAVMTADEQITEAYRFLAQELPGKGSLVERWQNYLEYFRVPELVNNPALAEKIIRTATKNIRTLVAERFEPDMLPQEEPHLTVVQSAPYAGRFVFNGRGKPAAFEAVMSNGKTAATMPSHLETALHELWPGHHSQVSRQFEAAERDGLGILYGSVIPSPYITISEGIAMNARSVTVTDTEFAEIACDLYAEVGRDISREDILRFLRLQRSREDATGAAQDNAIIMLLSQKVAAEQVKKYLQDYGLRNPDQAQSDAQMFIPAARGALFAYNTGRQAYRQWLNSLGDMQLQRKGYAMLCRDIVMPNQLPNFS